MITWILVGFLYICGAMIVHDENKGYNWQDWLDIFLWPLGVIASLIIRSIIRWFKYGDRG